nr:MAG TPA: tail tape measure protein [Caudoviricetes sp.]
MDIFSLVGKITINYADAVNNIEKVSKSAKDTAETLEDVDKKADGAGDSVEDAGQAAKNADSGFTTWKATLANLASTAITKVISGCTQLAEKMADVTKSAVGHYAEYEQLVGGVETLFKDSSGKLIDYAEKAYKTAGMSSNQYMNTATSFAASLIQGLGGDTAKAVELTNLAITDMSDNANKMGTDIGSIQDAYQGFAKQNYTMLDNLKLGYGGTQSEMIRLINDSGVLGEKIESLDNVTFDQMIEAIHKIQDNLGITGTTALEAGTTISGSWSSVQALFENILTKVGSKLAPTVMGFLQQLSDWMETIDWDAFATSVGDALQRVFDWIQKIDFTTFFEKGMDGVTEFIEGLGDFATKAIEVIGNIQSFIDILITLSPIILGVVTTLGSLAVAFKIGEIIDNVKTALTGLFAAMSANPIVAVIAIIAGLVVALVTLWNTNEDFRNAITGIWDSIKNVWESVKEAFANFVAAIGEKIEAVKEFFGNLKDAASEKFSAMKDVVSDKFSQIKETMGSTMQAAKDTVSEKLQNMKNAYSEHGGGIKGIAAAAMEGVKGYYSAGYTFIDNLTGGKLSAVANKFKSKMLEAKQAVSNKISEIKNSFSNGLGNAYSTVTNILGNIKNKFSNIMDSAKNIVSNAINRIKSFFNFSWSLPHLKLPHISISGSFSLTPPSVPHFGIDWYKKAMDDGMIMNQPTIFGYNAKSNQFLAGGEAGSETVVGTQSLMDMIRGATHDGVVDEVHSLRLDLNTLIEFLYNWLPQLANLKLVTDTGVLAGELAPAMDEELGKIFDKEGRR